LGGEGGRRTRRGRGSDRQETDNQQEGNQEPALSPSPIIEALLPDPAQPPAETTVLQGLLGRSDREGYWRLYFSTALNQYVEFRAEDVLYSEAIPKEESPLGVEAVRLWLNKEAKIMFPGYGYPGLELARAPYYGYPGFELARTPYYGYPGFELARTPYYGYPGFELARTPYYGYPGFELARTPYYGYPGFELARTPYYGYPLV
jgi:hypothetical protein